MFDKNPYWLDKRNSSSLVFSNSLSRFYFFPISLDRLDSIKFKMTALNEPDENGNKSILNNFVRPFVDLCIHPSIQPSNQPSTHPTIHPTNQPTNQPTIQSTNHPTNQPASIQPTIQPTNHPTNQPSNHRNIQPTNHQTNQQFTQDPTMQPTVQELTNRQYHPYFFRIQKSIGINKNISW